jgi:hypothetical protein
VGDPALEVRDPKDSTGDYKALYTAMLLHALRGEAPQVLEAEAAASLVRPRLMRDWLHAEMPVRLEELGLALKANQEPDARITSDPVAWLARLTREAGPAARPPLSILGGPGGGGIGRVGSGAGTSGVFQKASVRVPLFNLERATSTLLRSAVTGGEDLRRGIEAMRNESLHGARALAESAERNAQTFGPDHFETECGVKVRGATLKEAFMAGAQAQVLGPNLVRLQPAHPGASVLLVFDDGRGTLVPVIPGFIAGLTFDEGALVDVAYEPSTNTGRWEMYKERADEVRTLRGIAASSTRRGVFRLDSDNALAIARKMQYAKGIDP